MDNQQYDDFDQRDEYDNDYGDDSEEVYDEWEDDDNEDPYAPYDPLWFRDPGEMEMPTLKQRLRWWWINKKHQIRMIVDKRYRDSVHDIPF
jgi:hypothetical protein